MPTIVRIIDKWVQSPTPLPIQSPKSIRYQIIDWPYGLGVIQFRHRHKISNRVVIPYYYDPLPTSDWVHSVGGWSGGDDSWPDWDSLDHGEVSEMMS